MYTVQAQISHSLNDKAYSINLKKTKIYGA